MFSPEVLVALIKFTTFERGNIVTSQGAEGRRTLRLRKVLGSALTGYTRVYR
jgi:hypothetical protein